MHKETAMIIQMDMGSGEVEFARAAEVQEQRLQPAAPVAVVEARLECVASTPSEATRSLPTVDDIDAYLAKMHQISAAAGAIDT
jgi:hypothetical protein